MLIKPSRIKPCIRLKHNQAFRLIGIWSRDVRGACNWVYRTRESTCLWTIVGTSCKSISRHLCSLTCSSSTYASTSWSLPSTLSRSSPCSLLLLGWNRPFASVTVDCISFTSCSLHKKWILWNVINNSDKSLGLLPIDLSICLAVLLSVCLTLNERPWSSKLAEIV